MRPPQSCKCLPIFDTKNVTTLYHTPYYPDISPPDYFLFPKLKMKLNGLHSADVAEIQATVTDELKKSKRRNFQQLFRNCTSAQKPVYMPMEFILSKKKVCVFLMCLQLKKNQSQNFWSALCNFLC
jgi:hypothetical protein